jgi:uncharacterized protein YceK
MDKKVSKFVLALTVSLILSGCAGVGNYTNSKNHDDGFYNWGKGKNDWTHRY